LFSIEVKKKIDERIAQGSKEVDFDPRNVSPEFVLPEKGAGNVFRDVRKQVKIEKAEFEGAVR
jgi:hypothetical protein